MTWSSPVRAQPGSPLICGASGAAACMDVCELCLVLCLPSFFPLCLFLSPTVDQKSWIKSELNWINHLTRSKIWILKSKKKEIPSACTIALKLTQKSTHNSRNFHLCHGWCVSPQQKMPCFLISLLWSMLFQCQLVNSTKNKIQVTDNYIILSFNSRIYLSVGHNLIN